MSRAKSAVVPFEERVGMVAEHTPEKDLTRHYQIFEGGDKFERSFLRFACLVQVLHVPQTEAEGSGVVGIESN